MAKIGILTCSNSTQDLGCSSVVCLADLRKRKGAFAVYPKDEKLTLTGIINCPGCPTLTGSDKLLNRIRGLTEFGVDSIHFSYCIKALCPFKGNYEESLRDAFPHIKVILGTHEDHSTHDVFRTKVKTLFCQPRRTMVDIILDKNSRG